MYHMFHGNGLFRWLMPIMHLVVPVLAVYILFQIFSSRGLVYNQRRDSSALDILKERYARGEMSRDEFQRIKNEIRD